MTENKDENLGDNESKRTKTEEKDLSEKLKEIQNQIDLENSIIDNIENNLERYKKNKNINLNDENIFTNKKKNNNLLIKSDFLITSLTDGIINNKNIKNKNSNSNIKKNDIYEILPIKEEIKNEIKTLNNSNENNKKLFNQVKSSPSLTTINNTGNRNSVRYNILHNFLPNLKKIKSNIYNEEITEKEKEQEKLKLLNDLRRKELIIVKERKAKINQMIKNLSKLKLKESSSLKILKNKEKNYLYKTVEERERERQTEEEFLISLENEKRKKKLSPISNDELNKFSEEVKYNQKILKAELELKKLRLNTLWKKRKNLLPKYKSKFQEINMKNDEEKKNLEKIKQDQIKKEINNKKNYGEIVYRNFQPKKINDKLKTEREQKIKELNGIGRFNDIKNLGKKLKIISNKIHNSQPKNFKTNNKFIIEENTNKKTPLIHPIDYLNEARINDLKSLFSRRNKTNEILNKYDNQLNNKDSMYNNIMNIKLESKILQDKAREKKLLLKYEKNSRNINNNIDKLNEVSQLFFNSIQYKLKLLNQ